MNPALPSGALAGSEQGRAEGWSARASLVAGWVPYPERRLDGGAIPDPARPRLDVFLSTLQLGVGRATGPDLSLQLPLGVIGREDLVTPVRRDAGLGDLELRARYGFASGRLRGGAALGAAVPTGAYSPRSGQEALEGGGYLTLGRGSWALLPELDGAVDLSSRWSAFAGAAGRVALGEARDGYRWGREARGWAGARATFLRGRLAASLAVEAQHRAPGSQVDPFTGGRLEDASAGGTWWTLSPGLRLALPGSASVQAALRLPLASEGRGLQFAPGPGVFLGLGWSTPIGRASAPAAAPPVRGRVTLVYYWASWCEPCTRLGPVIAAAASNRPALEVVRRDASDWAPEELAAALPGAMGLPVIEVFREDGTRAARLVGEETFGVERVLEEVARR